MPNISIKSLLNAFFRELIAWRVLCVLLFGVTTFATLAVGFYWPKVYESKATIYVDQQNIIEPLLRGSAEVTRLDQAKVARETIYARSFLLQVGKEAKIEIPFEAREDNGIAQERLVTKLRNSIQVNRRGDRLIEVTSQSNDSAEAYAISSTVVSKFIQDSADAKRRESKEAFVFIDNQVKSYKEQLVGAESRLKAFKINNQEGTEDSVHQRLSDLRAKIQELQLKIEEEITKRKEVEAQLQKESEYLPHRYRADVYRKRLQELRNKLRLLRLDYTETYPDIVSIKLQIESLEQAISDSETQPTSTKEEQEPLTNPLFEELRLQLSETDVAVRVLNRRLTTLKRLMTEEQERLRRVATSNAELAELVRDYDVTKAIYEDMLERKEKARMSMALDIEGQGVSYRIQEPANFPLTPLGLRLMHFALAAPLLGVAIPIGLLIALIILDPRMRFPSQLENLEGVPLLGVVPHMPTPLSKRIRKWDAIGLLLCLFLMMAVYISILAARFFNVI
ncbi:MAG: chain length-determining protein [Gammaproteobacteria bacterium]